MWSNGLSTREVEEKEYMSEADSNMPAIVKESDVSIDGKRCINVWHLSREELIEALNYVRSKGMVCEVYAQLVCRYYAGDTVIKILTIEVSGNEAWHYRRTYRDCGYDYDDQIACIDEPMAGDLFIDMLDAYRIASSTTAVSQIEQEKAILREPPAPRPWLTGEARESQKRLFDEFRRLGAESESDTEVRC